MANIVDYRIRCKISPIVARICEALSLREKREDWSLTARAIWLDFGQIAVAERWRHRLAMCGLGRGAAAGYIWSIR
jgi:hypothetical protein